MKPRTPSPPREPLEIGTPIRDGLWAVARHEGQGRRTLRYLATGRAGRRVELKEHFPAGWRRTEAGCEPTEEVEAERAVAEFMREGWTLARDLESHPNLARVLDVFEDRGTFFVVQEWLDGESIEDQVRRRGPLTLEEALGRIAEAAEGLDALHRQGLLHRDVSPGNILLAKDRAVVFDFESLTPFPEVRSFGGRVLVNPAFAPLESLSVFKHYGPESDVYGLAATLYFALAGKAAPPAAARVANPRLPPPVKAPAPIFAAIERAMAVRAKERTQTVGQFLAELRKD